MSGLASMYPAFDWSVLAPGHHGYQRACELISDRPRSGHLGHQCSHAPGRPNLHLVSSSRRPRRESNFDLATSSRAPHCFARSLWPWAWNRDQAGWFAASSMTQCMVRPCVARDFRRSGGSGLASMYPAFDWSVSLLAIMDISARAISLAERPRSGHLGHQCSHAPGRPNLHLVSSSRRPRRENRRLVTRF